MLRINTALIRTTIHTRDLITEVFTVGNRNKIQCAVMYFQSIANPQLIEEVNGELRIYDMIILVTLTYSGILLKTILLIHFGRSIYGKARQSR